MKKIKCYSWLRILLDYRLPSYNWIVIGHYKLAGAWRGLRSLGYLKSLKSPTITGSDLEGATPRFRSKHILVRVQINQPLSFVRKRGLAGSGLARMVTN